VDQRTAKIGIVGALTDDDIVVDRDCDCNQIMQWINAVDERLLVNQLVLEEVDVADYDLGVGWPGRWRWPRVVLGDGLPLPAASGCYSVPVKRSAQVSRPIR